MPYISLINIGCKVNRSELEEIADSLSRCGVAASYSSNKADCTIINTCAVTGSAEAKSRKALRKALRESSGTVMVFGCLNSVKPRWTAGFSENRIIEIPASEKGSIVETALKEVRDIKTEDRIICRKQRARALIKVQDGCSRNCSYCVIPAARGEPYCVNRSDVIARAVSKASDKNIGEIVLVGINLGKYESENSHIDDLLRHVADAVNPVQVRLSSIDPEDINEDLLSAVSEKTNICKHLHLPLQSGSDAVLKHMGRGYTSSDYLGIIFKARKLMPDISFTTDLMVGYPTETESDFKDSLEVIRKAEFSKVHIFRYSKRCGTRAADIESPLCEIEIRRRAEIAKRAEIESRIRSVKRIRDLRVRAVCEKVFGMSAHIRTSQYFPSVISLIDGGISIAAGDIIEVIVKGIKSDGPWSVDVEPLEVICRGSSKSGA